MECMAACNHPRHHPDRQPKGTRHHQDGQINGKVSSNRYRRNAPIVRVFCVRIFIAQQGFTFRRNQPGRNSLPHCERIFNLNAVLWEADEITNHEYLQ